MNTIDTVERELGKTDTPAVEVGDDVEVKYLIREGDKERIQPFKGTVIAIKGRGNRRTMTVRRLVSGEGVERIFPLHSPRVQAIVVTRMGRVRRSKLYYLRDRVGKGARVRELLGPRAQKRREELGMGGARGKKKAAKAAPVSDEKGSESADEAPAAVEV
jgi:large subunit ribosomal protein L19